MVEATTSLVPEVREGELLVIDETWRTTFVASEPKLPAGVYLVSRLAKLAVREVSSVRGRFRRAGGSGYETPQGTGAHRPGRVYDSWPSNLARESATGSSDCRDAQIIVDRRFFEVY